MLLGIKFAYECRANTYLAAYTWIELLSHSTAFVKAPLPGYKRFYAGIFQGGNLQRLALSMEPRPSISLSLNFSRPGRQQRPGYASLSHALLELVETQDDCKCRVADSRRISPDVCHPSSPS